MLEPMSSSIFSSKGIKTLRTLSLLSLVKIGIFLGVFLLSFSVAKWILLKFVKDENPRTAAIASINAQTRVLIVGCSHVGTNINPSTIDPPAMNLSIPNANYTDVLRMLKKVWHMAPNLDVLIIEFSSPMLLRGSGGSIRSIAQLDFNYSDGFSLAEFMKNPDENLHLFLYYIYNWRLVPRHMFDNDFNSTRTKSIRYPGYEGFTVKLDPLKARLSSIKRYHAIFESTDRSSLEANSLALKETLLMAKEKNIKTIFLKMPEHEQLRYVRPSVLSDAPLLAIVKKNPVIDMMDWQHRDDDFFGDYDHLSELGALEFSHVIDKLLKEKSKVLPPVSVQRDS
jgi:hypothetical protein